MSDENQSSVASVTLVGMDAHTRVLSLCIAEWRHGSDPRIIRNIPNVLLEDMEKVYERWIPKDALTLVESSGNTRVIVNRLKAIGRKTEVLNADILRSISEKDKVNDRIDSEKLTYAYARGNACGKSVWMPSEEYAGYRDLISGYLRSSRDTTRCSNRIWAFCNSHGLPLPKRGRPKKAENIRASWTVCPSIGTSALSSMVRLRISSISARSVRRTSTESERSQSDERTFSG